MVFRNALIPSAFAGIPCSAPLNMTKGEALEHISAEQWGREIQLRGKVSGELPEAAW